ncbi:hypothetical protein DPMN_065068 [Dreissena polymorpha]|uniref:Uncharacterized protein n=1 Tax=Dreissena polymorpha TaxID=45954 RepID=A0A9D4CEH9_DREPO|nr:hypothetical protein DPMN_065068 [Dreissena polymorpha]
MKALCQNSLEEKQGPKEWTQSLIIPYRKRANSNCPRITASAASSVNLAKPCNALSSIN